MIFMGVLALKGIFPFGELRIDYYDMGQEIIPLYYHIWDCLHGKGTPLFTWLLCEGQNLSMDSCTQWNLSVFNILFLFIKRDSIIYFMSYYLAIHLFFMSFNMNLLIRKTMRTSSICRIAFSIAYGLTGYTLTHYTIITFLDTAVFIPIHLMLLYDLLSEKKNKRISSAAAYTAMTGYMTALGYYLAYMNLIFITLISGTYVFLLCGNESTDRYERYKRRARVAAKFGFSTLAGVGLSAFINVPAFMQLRDSFRFNSNYSAGLADTIHEILWAIGADMYYIKWWMLSGSLVAIVIIIIGLIKYRREYRVNLFIIGFCMYPCALIVFESINMLWHMGVYYHYPIRCGYLIPIVLLLSAAYFTGRLECEHLEDSDGRDYSKLCIITISVITAITAVVLMKYYILHDVWEITDLFKAWVIFSGVLMIIYFLIMILSRKIVYIVPFLMLELIVTAFIGYGPQNFTDKYSSDPEQSGDYILVSQSLNKEMGIKESNIERIKNPDTNLNANYALIMKRASIGGYITTTKRRQMDSANLLGYTIHYTRVLDSGGTLFSDAILHIKETITTTPDLYTDEAYEYEGEACGYTLLKNKYCMPFAMKTTEDLKDEEKTEALFSADVVSTTNNLYSLLNKSYEGSINETGIINDISHDIIGDKYHVNGLKALYLQGGSFEALKINGQIIPAPDIGNPNNTSYPGWFIQNLVFLGIYEDEDIVLEGIEGDDSSFYELDVNKLSTLCESANAEIQSIDAGETGINIIMDGEKDQMALIPLAYDRGYNAVVNGHKADIIDIGGMFIGIPINEGKNNICLSFMPQGLLLGTIITIVLLIMILWFNYRPLCSETLDRLSIVILAFVFWGLIIVLYLIPYIAFVIHQIEKRLL